MVVESTGTEPENVPPAVPGLEPPDAPSAIESSNNFDNQAAAFEELVFSYSKPRLAETPPEVEERWLPPDFLPKGSQSAGVSVAPAEGEIKVTVEVRLTSEARERITDQAIAKAAQTHQNHTEIVAKRLYELTREIRDREAARRVLYRR
jgi:hypothetical protein